MTAPPRVLVVDDEPNLRRALSISLRAKGYEVDAVADGRTALQTVLSFRPDVVVLDLGLPDLDGVEVLRSLRGWTTVPVLVLSARAGSDDKVRALDVGADDYVTKPFDVSELLARLRALARRAGGDAGPVTIGEYAVDGTTHTVTRASDGAPQHFTPTERQILGILIKAPGRLVTHEALLRGMGRDPAFTDSSYLRFYVGQLRRKLEPDHTRPRHLLTESGVGYRLIL